MEKVTEDELLNILHPLKDNLLYSITIHCDKHIFDKQIFYTCIIDIYKDEQLLKTYLCCRDGEFLKYRHYFTLIDTFYWSSRCFVVFTSFIED